MPRRYGIRPGGSGWPRLTGARPSRLTARGAPFLPGTGPLLPGTRPRLRVLLQGPDGFGERLDPGVVVCGAPDQPERQRRQVPDGNQSDVVAAEYRYSSRRRVHDPALGHQGHQLMNAAHRLGAADGPAGWRT